MPVVLAKRDAMVIDDDAWRGICKSLPAVVAEVLSVPNEPDGALTPDDIEVWPMEKNPFAVNNKPVEIVVLAQDFPQRRMNVKERAERIWAELHSSVPTEVNYFVWVFMGQTGFYT